MIKIWKYLKSCEYGNTIDGIMSNVGLARGTVKSNLFYLMMTDNVVEYCYGQNNKVYKIKNPEYNDSGLINSIEIN